MSKILVTGGAGFMGTHLVDALIERGHKVWAMDDLSGGYRENVNENAYFLRGDLRDKNMTDAATEDIDVVYHLAAYAAEGQSIFSPIEINDINIDSMNKLMVAVVNNNVKKVVFTSSMAVYGNSQYPFDEDMVKRPADPYGAAKAYCEDVLKQFAETYGFEYVIVRPHNVYGPRQNIADPFRNVLGIWMNRIMRGKPPIIFGDGDQVRAFSYIDDITIPLMNAGFYNVNGEIINLGSDEVKTINQACNIVIEAMGMKDKMEPMYVDPRAAEVKYAYSTTEKSARLLDYKTNHTLAQGVYKMAKWAVNKGAQQPTYRIPLEITKNAPTHWVNQDG